MVEIVSTLQLQHLMLFNIVSYILIVFAILTYLSVIEWSIHRFPMHIKGMSKIPVLGKLFAFFYKNHTIEHHTSYTHVHYECDDGGHAHHKIVLPIWAGPLLIAGAMIPVWIIDYVTSYQWNLTSICFVMATIYYILFEMVHVAMHETESIPRILFGESRWFCFLQRHHKLHHSKFSVCFNLLCPIADYLLGTTQK